MGSAGEGNQPSEFQAAGAARQGVGLVRYRQKAKVVLELPRGFGEVGRGRAIMEGAAAAEVDPEFVAMMIELELVTKEQAIEWGWLKGDNVLTTDTERCKGEKG